MNDYAAFMRAQHEAMVEVEERMAAMKNAEAERALENYNESCRAYKAEQDEVYASAIASGMTKDEAVLHIFKCGYGPRVYNPPLAAMVRYIVSK